MKRGMSILLLLVLLLASCGTGEPAVTGDPSPSGTEAPSGTTGPVPAETDALDYLPERDYTGTEFVILSASEQWKYMYAAEETNGDKLNDALYYRDAAVEEHFGVDLVFDVVNGYSTGASVVTEKLRAIVQAGDETYDLFNGSNAYGVLHGARSRSVPDLHDRQPVVPDLVGGERREAPGEAGRADRPACEAGGIRISVGGDAGGARERSRPCAPAAFSVFSRKFLDFREKICYNVDDPTIGE